MVKMQIHRITLNSEGHDHVNCLQSLLQYYWQGMLAYWCKLSPQKWLFWDNEEDSGHGKVTGSRDSLLISAEYTAGAGFAPPSFFRPDVIVACVFYE